MNAYCSTPAGIRRIKAVAREGNMLGPRLKRGQKTSPQRIQFAREWVSQWADKFTVARGEDGKLKIGR